MKEKLDAGGNKYKRRKMNIDVIALGHHDRQALEDFIHDRFGIEYSADIRYFMPKLLRLTSNSGEMIAAAGYRAAAEHKLFLEAYLDAPIEDVLSRHYGTQISRDSIVEVGNLADAYPGAGRAAITALTAYLSGMGYSWVVFTGVKKLRNGFARLSIETEQFGEADTGRLDSDELRSWGRYYQSGPMLVAGNIMKGFWALRFAREVLQPLWRVGLREGKQHARERRGRG
ncbi:MAG: thermostable hemolysin [Mariprofundaceae bacterium]